ncbi:unnamed protein product [Chironomus riparius]|uniref:Uncharacterized protein n=1 Tax=Chironomus riparius TaxID=315576 RepID=A0A9N9WSU3_9DIPT|nr:unnamed protein product [Chironomus riparius]
MKVPTVDKFLFYFPLEIGGYVIGGICLLISIAMITFPSIYITNILIVYNSFNESDQDALRNIIIMMLIYYGLTVSYFILLLAAGVLVILGTFFQKHKFLILHQILTVVQVISFFLMLFRFPFIALIPVLLFTVLGIYFFISIQSLYTSLKSKIQQLNISNGHQNGH